MKQLIKSYSHSIEDTHVQVGQVSQTLTSADFLPNKVFFQSYMFFHMNMKEMLWLILDPVLYFSFCDQL